MSRKRVGVFALLAVICVAFGNPEDCIEKANECKEKLLDIFSDDLTDAETCQEFRGVSGCLRNAADECLGEDEDPDVEKSLKEFEDLLDNNCQDDEATKCLDDNEDHLDDCVSGGDIEDISQLLQQELGMDPQFVNCHLYQLMVKCIERRSLERCGAEAAEMVFDLLSVALLKPRGKRAPQMAPVALLKPRGKRAPQMAPVALLKPRGKRAPQMAPVALLKPRRKRAP